LKRTSETITKTTSFSIEAILAGSAPRLTRRHARQELVRHVDVALPVLLEPGDRGVDLARRDRVERHSHHPGDEDGALMVAVRVKLAY
jgi:hypothetical protein